MNEISTAWLQRLLEAVATGPIGEEILGVARGERDLVVKENPHGAGWVVATAPKHVEHDGFSSTVADRWAEIYGKPQVDSAVGQTLGDA